MQTSLATFIRDTPEGREAESILRSCVHCGFCTATCPTYQLVGDELDGPRGRIYLIKQVLEGSPATSKTRDHLDRCLTCRSCETTCPSGVRYGRLADIHVLDTRGYRTDQPCGDGIGSACAEVNRADATMLGADQEAWLLRNLEGRHATWQVLAQQVMVMERDLGDDVRGRMISMDKWDAMPVARQRLLDGVRQRNVGNLVVLTGDVHNAWAGEVRASGGQGPALMTEFCASSISSNGDGSEALAATPTVLRRNPHISFFNNRRGYCLHEAGPKQMAVSFRAVDYVTRPGAPLVDKARFVVEAGRATIASA